MSQPQQSAKPQAKKSAGKEAIETLVVIVEALLIAFVFRSFLYQPFSIPTGSLQSTLMIGDYVVANKWVWGYGRYSTVVVGDVPMLPINSRLFQFNEPQRGDIAVFRNSISNEDYIKRIIGLPGDTVQMQDGRLYINGTMVEREEVGTTVDFDSRNSDVEVTVYRETLPNGVTHIIQEISDSAPLDNTAVYEVPAGHYFMMGDNRDRSQDSRVLSAVGYVPAVDIVGKAEAIFFSIKDNLPPWQIWQWPENLRLDRMFQSVYE